jgi:oxaloacetate decarboxylase alpha subunit
LEFLRGLGELMRREGIAELEILDGDRAVILRLREGEEREHQRVPSPAGDLVEVTAPLSGILHLSPSPGEEPYAPAGSFRRKGEVLFAVEAMKHLNEVEAPCDLTVLEILAEEGRAVKEGRAVLLCRREDDGE